MKALDNSKRCQYAAKQNQRTTQTFEYFRNLFFFAFYHRSKAANLVRNICTCVLKKKKDAIPKRIAKVLSSRFQNGYFNLTDTLSGQFSFVWT